MFQESFPKKFTAFQRNIMLHSTHRSYPSRRNACFFVSFWVGEGVGGGQV